MVSANVDLPERCVKVVRCSEIQLRQKQKQIERPFQQYADKRKQGGTAS